MQLLFSNKAYVKITGGETFLYPHIFDLIEYMELIRLNYIIYTNGPFIYQYINKLMHLHHLVMLRVSLEGTKERNDIIRENGVFDITINDINYSINHAINRSNYNLLPLLENYLLNECRLNVPIHIGFVKHAGNSLRNRNICFLIQWNTILQ